MVELLPKWTLHAVEVVAVFRSRSGRVKRTTRFVQLLHSGVTGLVSGI